MSICLRIDQERKKSDCLVWCVRCWMAVAMDHRWWYRVVRNWSDYVDDSYGYYVYQRAYRWA